MTPEQLALAIVYSKFVLVAFIGVMLFDLFLRISYKMTLSSAYDKLMSTPYRWIPILITALVCLLLLHLNTTLFF